MIKEYLESRFKCGKLYNSWLIQADDIKKALEDLQFFVSQILLRGELDLANHPDFKLAVRQTSIANNKNISIEQIRDLQEFLNKTSAISGSKIAIIYQADLMNLNAANACLKILEDTPKNSYIFLVTSKASSILSTIRSRCAKLNCQSQNQLVNDEVYTKFITALTNSSNPNLKLELIKEFSDKNRELWANFADNALHLISRITKKSAGSHLELSK